MDFNAYIVVGCIVAVAFAFLVVYFTNKIAPKINQKAENIKNKIKEKVGITVYANLEHAIITAIYDAEAKFLGYLNDKYGINRHNFAKEAIKAVVRKLGIEDKMSDEEIDLIIKFYVVALKLAKGQNPFK